VFFLIDFDYSDKQTDVVSSSCFERIDVPITVFIYDEEKLVKEIKAIKSSLIEFKEFFNKQCVLTLDDAKKIASASQITIRFSGDQYRDFKLNGKDIQSLRDMMQYYFWVLTDIGEKANEIKDASTKEGERNDS